MNSKMLQIKKNLEPDSLTVYRLTENANFSDCPPDVKIEIKKSLLENQKYICAYCMQRISLDDMKVEHFLPQSLYPNDDLNYQNLFAVCNGNEGSKPDRQTCDTKKGNSILPFSLIIPNLECLVRYRPATGEIVFAEYQQEINSILNLNDSKGYLMENRKSALRALQLTIERKYRNRRASKPELVKILNTIESQPKMSPFAGIMIWYLRDRCNL